MHPRIFSPRPEFVRLCVTAYHRKSNGRRPRGLECARVIRNAPELGTIWAQPNGLSVVSYQLHSRVKSNPRSPALVP